MSASPKVDSSPRATLDQSSNSPPFDDLALDSELLAIFVQTKSRPAAEQLIRRHSPMVAGVIRRMIQNASDAEDAYQATFLILLQSAQKIRNQTSLSAWLYGVAYRTAYRVRQRTQKHRGIDMNEAPFAPVYLDNPLEKVAIESQLELLDRELNTLRPDLRETLVEYHLLGFTSPQIAERLNISLSAVEGRLRRGRACLRQRLARRGISFSVSFAVAAAYQQSCVAALAQNWQQGLLESELISQAITTDTPTTNPSLQPLIQGEFAMRSTYLKWATFSAAAACLATVLGVGSYLTTVDGHGLDAGIAVAAATSKESTMDARFDAVTGSRPVDAPPTALEPPRNTILGNQFGGASTDQSDEQGGGLGGGGLNVSDGSMESAKPIKVVPFSKPIGPVPNWMKDGGTIAQEESKAKEEIRTQMRNRVSLDFNNTPLRSVLESLAASARLPILIDSVGLESSGDVTPEDPVTLSGIHEVSLQRALRLILAPKGLTYAVMPECIMITTKDHGASRTTRTYDLAHFLPSDEKVQALVMLIQATIRSNWEVLGGDDTVIPFGSVLVVNCPEETHLEIEGLLFELSKINRENL